MMRADRLSRKLCLRTFAASLPWADRARFPGTRVLPFQGRPGVGRGPDASGHRPGKSQPGGSPHDGYAVSRRERQIVPYARQNRLTGTSPQSISGVVAIPFVIGLGIEFGVLFLDELARRRQAGTSILARPKARAPQRLGALIVDFLDGDDDHGSWRLAAALERPDQLFAVTMAAPLTRTTLSQPGTMNIRLVRPSKTMFRRESSRLLPRQSGIRMVRSSAIRTTGLASPRGLASVPPGPTVESTTNREAPIHLRHRGVSRAETLVTAPGATEP